MFGRPTFWQSDKAYEEVVLEALDCLNVPVLTGVDIGHKPPYMTMVNGAYGVMDYENGTLKFQMRNEKQTREFCVKE